jgi:hypothetical protein
MAVLRVEFDKQAAHPVHERWNDFRDTTGLRGGIATLGYSWADVAGHPCEGTAEVAAILRLGGWTGTL